MTEALLERPQKNGSYMSKADELLRLHGTFGELTTEQVIVLLGLNDEKSNSRTRDRLRRLAQHEWLVRYQQERKPNTPVQLPSGPLVSCLGRKGVAYCKDPDREWVDRAYWFNHEKAPVVSQHNLERTNVHICLDRGLPGGHQLTKWTQLERHLEDRQHHINPDMFSEIEGPNGFHYSFWDVIEAKTRKPRAQENAIVHKCREMYEYRKKLLDAVQSGHILFDFCRSMEDFHYRLVFPSTVRMTNMLAMVKKAFPNSEMFRFTCKEYYDWREPESMLAPIFYSPKNYETGAKYGLLD